MSKKVRRVPYTLESSGISTLTDEEIRLILRAADPLIARAGRDMLVKVLKGSKEKKILEFELDQCPAYGCFSEKTKEETARMVDWVIAENYLELEYFYRLPLLVFTEKGWAIERETYAQELYEKIMADVRNNTPDQVLKMEDTNRQVVKLVLEKIREKGEKACIPQLRLWQEKEVRKVREHIDSVIRTIEKSDRLLVVFPGIGYTFDRPLLYYTQRIAKKLGYRIQRISFSVPDTDVKNSQEKQAEAARLAYMQACEQLKDTDLDAYGRVVFAGKSLGSVVCALYADRHQLRADEILLTPVSATFDAEFRAKTVAFTGTADSWADTDEIRKLCAERKAELHVIEGANHSLETSDLTLDLQNLLKIMKTIEAFLC